MSAAVATCVDDDCRHSHCDRCDAHPHECTHTGARYLAPVVYTAVTGTGGERIGFKVADRERERWENPVKATRPHPPGWEPGAVARELPDLLTDLGGWFYFDVELERQFRLAYARDAMRATRLAEKVLLTAKEGKLSNPAGLLASHLAKDLAREASVTS